MLNSVLNTDAGHGVKVVGGGKLQRTGKRYSRTLRAILAEQLISGPLAVNRLSPKQAAAITETTMAEIRAIRRARTASLALYLDMKIGRVDVDAVRKWQLANKPVSDERLKRLIERAGIDRVFGVLDELTKPVNANAAVTVNPHTANGNGSAITAPQAIL
jgi:hypothetical protein